MAFCFGFDSDMIACVFLQRFLVLCLHLLYDEALPHPPWQGPLRDLCHLAAGSDHQLPQPLLHLQPGLVLLWLLEQHELNEL